MEATFQSYLAEAVYSMEREKRQRLESESSDQQDLHPALRKLSTTSSLNHGLISYIDADSDHEVDEGPQGAAASSFPKESADLVSAPVKMRQGGSNRRRRGLPRPSGFNISTEKPPPNAVLQASNAAAGLFQRNMKFFLSFNKKQRRRSSASSISTQPYLR